MELAAATAKTNSVADSVTPERAAPEAEHLLGPAAPVPIPVERRARTSASGAPGTPDAPAGPPASLSRLRRLPATGTDRPQVIRRTPSWGPKTHRDTSLDSWAAGLETLVKEGANVALTRYNDLTGTDGSTSRWKETAARLVAYRDSPHTLPPVGFGPAYYGYAIEVYALDRLHTLKLPDGFTVAKQVTFGMTRPDVVVYREGQDVGWFDITSLRSKGHIYKKAGSQWKTRPYVAEIVYDNFDISRLAPGNTSPVEQQRAQEQYRQKLAAWDGIVTRMRGGFLLTFEQIGTAAVKTKGSGLNQKELKQAVRDALSQSVGKALQLGECRDVLRAFGIDPKSYGLGKGGDKQKGHAYLRGLAPDQPDELAEEEVPDVSEDDETADQEGLSEQQPALAGAAAAGQLVTVGQLDAMEE